MDCTEEMASMVAGRPEWVRSGDDEWRMEAHGGRLIGLIRVVAGALEARVLRHPTGPTPGPDPEVAHGPQVFEDAGAALGYVERNVEGV